jgi:hypothetical protein
VNAVVLYLLLLRATALSFSGFASVPVIREDLVVTRGVLTDEELNSAIAISQASPGPLGLYVVVLGYFVAGVPGAFAGALALATPAILAIPIARGAAPSGFTGPRRLLGHRYSVVRADGNNERALSAGGCADSSVCAAGGRCIHCACFRVRAAGRCHHRVGLRRTVLDVDDAQCVSGACASPPTLNLRLHQRQDRHAPMHCHFECGDRRVRMNIATYAAK